MVDSQSRRRLAELARALANGRLTNTEFELALPKSEDPAINAIYNFGLWPLYDDIREHHLVGRDSLSQENRRWVARCILFLRSNQPYRWPRWPHAARRAAALLRFLGCDEFTKSWWGAPEAWPFWTHAQYQAALREPPYFHGAGSNNSFKGMPLRGTP